MTATRRQQRIAQHRPRGQLVCESVATVQREAITEAGTAKAGAKPGRIAITLIKAGWSLNGRYYSPAVLERDAATTWPAGTLSFADHQTEAEDEARPVGSVRNAVGYLESAAAWDPTTQSVVGVLRPFEHWRPAVESWAKSGALGMSIRAFMDATPGEVDGRRGNVVSALYGGPGQSSVDVVTAPAAGGSLDAVLESLGHPVNLAEARNVGHWFESRIHNSFTNIADSMFGDGRLTREERITLSTAIGKALAAFSGHIEAEAPHLYSRDPWDEPEGTTAQAAEAKLTRPIAEATSEEIRRALTAALREAYSTGRTPAYIWLRDYDSEASLCWYEQSTRDGDCATYQEAYTVSDAGRITLAGKRIEVVTRTVYDPAPSGASAATVRPGEASTGEPVVEEVQPADGPAAPPNPQKEETVTGPQNTGQQSGTGGAGEPARNPHAEALSEAHQAVITANKRADEAAKLAEENARKLRIFEATEAARGQVAEAIAKSPLAKAGATHPRITERVVAAREVWLGEDGKADSAKLATTIEATVTAEAAYIAQAAEQLYGVGQVKGLGGGTATTEQTEEAFESDIEAEFREIGLSESAAKRAAKGR